MNILKKQNDYRPISSERTFPASPFPYAYIHCVLDDLSDAVQAVLALRLAHCDSRDIHVMASWDATEAVERKRLRQNPLVSALTSLTNFLDEGLGNVYYQEACRGRHLLMVRATTQQQIEPMCHLLAHYRAHLIKYVGRWVVTDVFP